MPHWVVELFDGEPVGDICDCTEFDHDHYYDEEPEDNDDDV